MASTSAIRLTAIQEFFGRDFARASRRGENALEAGHLLSFLYDGEMGHISAKVHGSQRDTQYTVTIQFRRLHIVSAHCTCARGLVNCHHMAAVLLHTHKNVSVTDGSCHWSRRKAAKGDGKPIDSLYPRKKKDYNALSGDISNVVWRRVLSQVEQCKGAASGLVWLLSPESEPDESSETYQGITGSLLHPRDVVLSTEFEAAPDRSEFLIHKLRLSWETILSVASATKGQASNPLWALVREWRLTASNFGKILATCRARERRTRVVAQSILKMLYAPRSLDKVKAVMWGRENEKSVVEEFSRSTGLSVEETGVWLHECGFLGSSPDGLVGEDAVLEVKCPWRYRNSSLEEAYSQVNKKNVAHCQDGVWSINDTHDFYHQIQGEMLCTRISACYLVLWSTKSLVILKISKDEAWASNVPTLQNFYNEHFVPYILQRNRSSSL